MTCGTSWRLHTQPVMSKLYIVCAERTNWEKHLNELNNLIAQLAMQNVSIDER